MNNDPLILVDMMNLVFRSHYAYKGLSHEGKPTGYVYGCLNTILNLRQAFGDRMIFCWDHGLSEDTAHQNGEMRKLNWRYSIFPAYKRNRKQPDEKITSMLQTLPLLQTALRNLGWQNIGVPGLEADDIIGILTETGPALIFSTDQDLYQLLDGDRVKMIIPKRTESGYQILTQKQVEREHTLAVSAWAKYLALGGDSSDDIHVMPGVGPKTAIKLIRAGIDLEKLWEEQPIGFQQQWPICSQYWTNLQAAYEVARIPRSITDKRIYFLLKDWPKQVQYERQLEDKDEMLKSFAGFCSDWGLMEHLAKRREFL